MKLNFEKINWKILLALSWWVDSVVLLDLLVKKFDKSEIIIWHYNHNLRWKESDDDELFCKKISSKNWIKFYYEKAKKSPKNEDEARNLRYNFLIKIAEKENCNYIATAQHKDDQVETLLLQLIRWTWGFSPMQIKTKDKRLKTKDILYRPLLNFSKKEIIEYAKDNKLSWREDSTNKESIFTRNKIRNEILPKLNEINPSFWESLINLANLSSTWADFIRQEAAEHISEINWNPELISKSSVLKVISKRVFDWLHLAMKRWVIKNLNHNLTAKNVAEVVEMIEKWIWWKEKHWIYLNNWIIQGVKKWKLENDNWKNNRSLFNSFNLKSSVLILASQSPQRKRLLSKITENFLVIPSKYDEVWNDEKSIEENISMFWENKALEVARKYPDSLVIWCDTFVVHPKNWVYLKPKDIDEARKMLLSYSSSKIKVLSWISLLSVWKDKKIKKDSRLSETQIEFWEIGQDEVEEWLTMNEWQWRSWACSIEWYTARFVKRIDGCFFNIIWLPVSLLKQMLDEF